MPAGSLQQLSRNFQGEGGLVFVLADRAFDGAAAEDVPLSPATKL